MLDISLSQQLLEVLDGHRALGFSHLLQQVASEYHSVEAYFAANDSLKSYRKL